MKTFILATMCFFFVTNHSDDFDIKHFMTSTVIASANCGNNFNPLSANTTKWLNTLK